MTSTTATAVTAAVAEQCVFGVPQVKENEWVQAQTGEHLTNFVQKMVEVRLPKFMENRRKGTARAIRRATEAANLGLQGKGMSFCADGSMVINLFPGYYNPNKELRKIHQAFAKCVADHLFASHDYDTAAADNGAWFSVRLGSEYLDGLLYSGFYNSETAAERLQLNIESMIADLLLIVEKFKAICNRAVSGRAGWKSYT